MDNTKSNLCDNRLMNITMSAKSRLRTILPPANYADKLFDRLKNQIDQLPEIPHQVYIDQLFCLMENDYKKYGLIGKGYHCMEHSLELTLLILESWKSPAPYLPPLSSSELLEMVVASMLHDYDPHAFRKVPQVERTLYVLKTDYLLRDILEKLGIRIANVALLIERTDYPFTVEKEMSWDGKLFLHFSDEKERLRFVDRAEKLALLDKACTYFSLMPEEAQKRVEGLAEEMGCSKEKLLIETHQFLLREGVVQAVRWVPDSYRKRWELVERHFRNIAERTTAG